MTDRIVLGLVLFAPATVYPQHHHQGIQESYVAVAGEWSENDVAVHPPGSLVLSEAGQRTSHHDRMSGARRDHVVNRGEGWEGKSVVLNSQERDLDGQPLSPCVELQTQTRTGALACPLRHVVREGGMRSLSPSGATGARLLSSLRHELLPVSVRNWPCL